MRFAWMASALLVRAIGIEKATELAMGDAINNGMIPNTVSASNGEI